VDLQAYKAELCSHIMFFCLITMNLIVRPKAEQCSNIMCIIMFILQMYVNFNCEAEGRAAFTHRVHSNTVTCMLENKILSLDVENRVACNLPLDSLLRNNLAWAFKQISSIVGRRNDYFIVLR
jgi:hypothetical protein